MVIPEAATPGLPGEPSPNRAPARRRSRWLIGLCDATVKGELAEQLQWALDHRVLIEQAKRVLMEREGLSPAAAFVRLRTTARTVGRTVGELAGIVLAGGSLPRHRAPNPDRPQGRSGVAKLPSVILASLTVCRRPAETLHWLGGLPSRGAAGRLLVRSSRT
jgi:ANTAR domain